MSKITTEIRYKKMSFDFIREVKGLKMYIDKDCAYCMNALHITTLNSF